MHRTIPGFIFWIAPVLTESVQDPPNINVTEKDELDLVWTSGTHEMQDAGCHHPSWLQSSFLLCPVLQYILLYWARGYKQ